MFRLLGQAKKQGNVQNQNISALAEHNEKANSNNRGWGAWGKQTHPQHQGFFSGPQSPLKGTSATESKGFFGLASPSLAFGTQAQSEQQKKLDKEEAYELKMKEKRKLNDLDWFAEYLDERKQAGEELNSDEQYGRLLMDLHRSGAKLDAHELDELKGTAKKIRQEATVKEQEKGKVKQRKEMKELSDEEMLDVQTFDQKRENDEMQEYLDLLDLKEDGKPIDTARLYTLELLDRRRCGEPLESDELKLLEDYDQQVREEHLDRIEMKFLVGLKQQGEKIDECRLRELELMHLKRQGVDLNEEEANELKRFQERRMHEKRYVLDYDELKEKKTKGERVDKEQFYCLGLLDRKLAGEKLSDAEIDDLDFYVTEREEEERLDLEELDDLLDRKERGETIDDLRLHELSILEKKRRRDSLTPADEEDLALFLRRRQEMQTRTKSTMSGETARSLESNELRRKGLPPTISVGSPACFDQSFLSIGGFSGASYIEDLIAQKQKRDDERNEQALEEALELYHVALRESNEKENELLFTQIYQDVLKKNKEKYKEEDRIADEHLDREAEAYERRIKEMEAEKARWKTQHVNVREQSSGSNEDASHLIFQGEKFSSLGDSREYGSSLHDPTTARLEKHEGTESSLERGENQSVLVLSRSQEQADREELTELLDRLDRGEPIDEDRLYELELVERHRQGESLTADEIEDLEFLMNERPSTVDNGKERNVAIESLVDAEVKSNLVLLDQHDVNKPLENLNEDGVKKDSDRTGHVPARNQEYADMDELNELLDRLDRGEPIDEDRLYELELLERHRQGESLTADEIEDLEFLMNERSSAKGNDTEKNIAIESLVNAEVTSNLALLDRHGANEPLEHPNQDDLNRDDDATDPVLPRSQEQADKDELIDILDRLDKGQPIDEDRLYELELLERYRLGGSLTADEIEDVEYLMIERSGAQINDTAERVTNNSQNSKTGVMSDSKSALHETEVRNVKEDLESVSSGTSTSSILLKGENQSDTRHTETGIDKDEDETDPMPLSCQEQEDRRELNYMLDRLDRGETVDEDKLYELELVERYCQGESLTEDEIDDVEYLMRERMHAKGNAAEDYKVAESLSGSETMSRSEGVSDRRESKRDLVHSPTHAHHESVRGELLGVSTHQDSNYDGSGIVEVEKSKTNDDLLQKGEAKPVSSMVPKRATSKETISEATLGFSSIDVPEQEIQGRLTGSAVEAVRYKKRQLEIKFLGMKNSADTAGTNNNALEATQKEEQKDGDGIITVLRGDTDVSHDEGAREGEKFGSALKGQSFSNDKSKAPQYQGNVKSDLTLKDTAAFDRSIDHMELEEQVALISDAKQKIQVSTISTNIKLTLTDQNKEREETESSIYAAERKSKVESWFENHQEDPDALEEDSEPPKRFSSDKSLSLSQSEPRLTTGRDEDRTVNPTTPKESEARFHSHSGIDEVDILPERWKTLGPDRQASETEEAGRDQLEKEKGMRFDITKEKRIDAATAVVGEGASDRLQSTDQLLLELQDAAEEIADRMEHVERNTVATSSPARAEQKDLTFAFHETDEENKPSREDEEFVSNLLQRQRMGEVLNNDELCEMKLLNRQLEGGNLSSEEKEMLGSLKTKRVCRLELKTLKEKFQEKHSFDELRLCELELLELVWRGHQLTPNEEYEMVLYQRRRAGEDLSDQELEEVDYFVDKRLMYNALDFKLDTLRNQEKLGVEIDPDLLFELELFERARQRKPLDKMEQLAVDLLERNRLGENLTDDDMDDFLDIMEVLKSKKASEKHASNLESEKMAVPLSEEDSEYMQELRQRQMDGEALNDFEAFELSVMERLKQGEVVETVEVEELKLVRRRRLHAGELEYLRSQRDKGEEHDSDRLYELELYERNRRGQPLDENELYELQLFEKRKGGETLDDEEVVDLDMLRKQRALDEEDLALLREDKANGKEVDEDLLYELELFHRNRTCENLTDDEFMELEIFTRRRNGENLTAADLEELELLKAIRTEKALDEMELMDLRGKKAKGELVDENLLYELELFHRERRGDELNEDELFELSCFESRRAGEDLSDEDLDELDRLKRRRLLSDGAFREQLEEDDDSEYVRELQQKQEQGEDLADEELLALSLIKKNKAGVDLSKAELEELVALRRRRQVGLLETDEPFAKSTGEMGRSKRRNDSKKSRPERKHSTSLEDGSSETLQTEDVVGTQGQSLGAAKERLTGQIPTSKQTTAPILKPLTPSVPTQPQKNQGLLGGLFGNRRKQKELELEMQRREQEELIRQQLEAMNLQEELKKLEEMQQEQEVLIRQKTEENHPDNADSASSFESKGRLDADDGLPPSVDDHPPTHSNVAPVGHDTKLQAEAEGNATANGRDGTCQKPKVVSPIGSTQFSFKRKATQRSLLVKRAVLNRNFDDETENSPLSRNSATGSPKPSISSPLRSLKFEDDKKSPRNLFQKQLALTLSAHLSANVIEDDDTNQFGDEISIGLVEETRRTTVSEKANRSKKLKSSSEVKRPWRSAAKKGSGRIPDEQLGAIDEEEKMIDDEYIKEVFEKSVFTFESQRDNDVLEEQNDEGELEEEKDVTSAPSLDSNQPKDGINEDGIEQGSLQSSHPDVEISTSETDGLERASKTKELRMMTSISELNFTDLTGYDFEGLESKIDEKKKSDDTKFDEYWENEKADKAAVAQFNQMRHAREREKLKRKEAAAENIPRLFLFEGERRRNKKKQVKKSRKLEGKLSREFRKAMESIFESDSEEEYDKNFRVRDEEGKAPLTRSLSYDSIMFDGFSDSSGSEASEAAEDEAEADASSGFDYLKELQKRSMQHDARDRFPAEPTVKSGTISGDEIRQIADHAYAQRVAEGNNSLSTSASKRQPRSVENSSRHTFDTMDIDPAEVYAQEVEKSKERKKFSVADFRKEIEDLSKKRISTFEDAPIQSLIAPNDLKIQEKSMVLEQQKSRRFVKRGKKSQPGLLDATIGGNIAEEPFDDQSQAAGSQAAFLTATKSRKQKPFDILLKGNQSEGKGFGKVFDSFIPATSAAFSTAKLKLGVGNGDSRKSDAYPEPLPVPQPQSDREKKKGWKQKGANLKKLAGKAGKAIPAKKLKKLAFGRKTAHQSMMDDGGFDQGLLG
eukprot:scaffold4026_cov117-Cylindrotheca_fusiformis.AAC.41